MNEISHQPKKHKNPDKTQKSQCTDHKYAMLTTISHKTQKSRQYIKITKVMSEIYRLSKTQKSRQFLKITMSNTKVMNEIYNLSKIQKSRQDTEITIYKTEVCDAI